MNRLSARAKRTFIAFVLLSAIAFATACNAPEETIASVGTETRTLDKLNPSQWSDRYLTIANLGHATLAMNYFGVRVVSDPTLFDRVGLALDSILTIGPRRHVAPPLTAAELGPIDVILVTHAHMDHLDIPSLAALPKTAPVIACTK